MASSSWSRHPFLHFSTSLSLSLPFPLSSPLTAGKCNCWARKVIIEKKADMIVLDFSWFASPAGPEQRLFHLLYMARQCYWIKVALNFGCFKLPDRFKIIFVMLRKPECFIRFQLFFSSSVCYPEEFRLIASCLPCPAPPPPPPLFPNVHLQEDIEDEMNFLDRYSLASLISHRSSPITRHYSVSAKELSSELSVLHRVFIFQCSPTSFLPHWSPLICLPLSFLLKELSVSLSPSELA